jgi:hypothetical protein
MPPPRPHRLRRRAGAVCAGQQSSVATTAPRHLPDCCAIWRRSAAPFRFAARRPEAPQFSGRRGSSLQGDHYRGRSRAADAFLVVIGEYNWGPQPGLKNPTDHLLEEWFWRPAAIASYSAGRFSGVRSATTSRGGPKRRASSGGARSRPTSSGDGGRRAAGRAAQLRRIEGTTAGPGKMAPAPPRKIGAWRSTRSIPPAAR